ncbi:MAG: hypothetical protein HN738_02455 [Gammaproteobacteria bacterium]|jgi:hypothetical protein|nr:hypothetical protein [Gammaproteobacteria bacterium]
MEYVEVAVDILGVIVALVFAITPVIVARVQTGKFDLTKTLEAAEDVAHVIEDVEECVKKIEEIRGKKLSKKMKRKAEARVKRIQQQTSE